MRVNLEIFPQRRKPVMLVAVVGMGEELVEKASNLNEIPESMPLGLKPGLVLCGLTPGMNPQPTARTSFSASWEALPF